MKISLSRLTKILFVIIIISWITPSFRHPYVNAQAVYGPETVWSPTDEAQNEAMQCWISGNLDCLLQVMRKHNASPQTIAFTEQLQGEGYMSSFEEKGIVDLAMVIYPIRANDNFQPVLVNGQPGIVHIEDVWHTDLSADQLYPSLIARYPEMTLWGGDNGFAGLEQIPGGGQSFKISYSLVDGCHACEVVGTAFIAFDFDSSGTFIGTRLLGLSEGHQPPAEPVEPFKPVEESSASNGKWIAFLDTQQNVWMIGSDGTEMRQITDDAQIIYDDQGLNIGIVNYFHLEWSPDGSKLAFVRHDSDFKEYVERRSFWIYSVENGLTDRFDIYIQNYTWNPNSRAIDFSPQVPDILDPNLPQDSIQGLLELDITTREITEIIPPQNGRPIIAPAWSPDGKKISFDEVIYIEGRGNFGYYDFETNSYITWEEDLENQIGNYSWFPDSQHIAYDGVGYVPGPGARIWKTDLEQTSSIPLINLDVVQFAYWPKVSPRGNQIAYLASYPGQMMEQTGLWVANQDGSNARQISEHESAAGPTWSPDGTAILYSVREPDGSRSIYIYEFALNKSRPLTEGSFPRWQPGLKEETYSISGRITEFDMGNPIPGVTVSDNSGHLAETDAEGYYTIRGLAEGTYEIIPEISPFESTIRIFVPESRTVTIPPNKEDQDFIGSGDSDGDALYDIWEVEGYDADGDGDVDVPLHEMGADPNVKDIFVEVDYMVEYECPIEGIYCRYTHNHKPNPDAMAEVVNAFSESPVDENQGINLHVDFGEDTPMKEGTNWGSFSLSDEIAENEMFIALSPEEFLFAKSVYFTKAREGIFHYAIFGHFFEGEELGKCTAGRSISAPGMDFMVTLGGFKKIPSPLIENDYDPYDCTNPDNQHSVGSKNQQAATFMHELGHNLGLCHGGYEETINYKPNYLSIMNTPFGIEGLISRIQILGISYPIFKVDYSRNDDIPDLIEVSLDETIGINGGTSSEKYGTSWMCPNQEITHTLQANGPIDWNCNGIIDQSTVQANINNTEKYPSELGDTLRDYNDWLHLDFEGHKYPLEKNKCQEIAGKEQPEPTYADYALLSHPYDFMIDGPGGLISSQGYSTEIEIELTNVGDNPDNYQIEISSNPAWVNLSAIPKDVHLEPGDTHIVTIPIHFPASTNFGDKNTIRTKVTSSGNPALWDSFYIYLEVSEHPEEYFEEIAAIEAEESQGIIKSIFQGLEEFQLISFAIAFLLLGLLVLIVLAIIVIFVSRKGRTKSS